MKIYSLQSAAGGFLVVPVKCSILKNNICIEIQSHAQHFYCVCAQTIVVKFHIDLNSCTEHIGTNLLISFHFKSFSLQF